MNKMSHHFEENALSYKKANVATESIVTNEAEIVENKLSSDLEKNQPITESLYQILGNEMTNNKTQNEQALTSEMLIKQENTTHHPQETLTNLLKKNPSPSKLVEAIDELRQSYYADIIRDSK